MIKSMCQDQVAPSHQIEIMTEKGYKVGRKRKWKRPVYYIVKKYVKKFYTKIDNSPQW